MTITAKNADDRVLVISRVLNAPRERVFDAWTHAEHMLHWWGPKDFTVPFAEMNAAPGGTYRACIRSPDGVDYWMRGVFREVARPSRLVFSWAWDDEAERPGHETLITLSFEDVSGRTLMTFRQEVFESVEQRDSHEGGWTECFDRLAHYVERTQ